MKGQANAYSHTLCQTAQAAPKAQVWQRVCLSNRTADRKDAAKMKEK